MRFIRNLIKKLLFRIRHFFLDDITSKTENNMLLTARLLIDRIRNGNLADIHSSEFRVFSQWGEDGIIQFLIHKVPIKNKVFVELGVERYTESNTRFLLINDNWKGLVLDSSQADIDYIEQDPIYWKYDLTADCAFITRENINQLLIENGFEGEIGLLSIDLDGNDYWIWEGIDCLNPCIVICEYNSVLGDKHSVTIPYEANFIRTNAHFSNLYYGCSLPALCQLADKKGYEFVGSNSAGSNAFFVRKDLHHGVKALSVKEGYVKSKVRESRDAAGRLTFIGGSARARLIKDLPVFDLEQQKILPIKDIV